MVTANLNNKDSYVFGGRNKDKKGYKKKIITGSIAV